MIDIRSATAADVPLLLQLVRELAAYERAPGAVVANEGDFLRDGFGAAPKFFAEVARWDAQPAGFALWFFNWSTWQGKPGLYLEDVFVRPEFRGRGIGKALLVHLARRAVNAGCGRFQWQVLDWNERAIRFYESLGAGTLREWLTMRIEGDAIARLAGG